MDTEIPEKKNFLSFVKSNSKTIISIVSILILFIKPNYYAQGILGITKMSAFDKGTLSTNIINYELINNFELILPIKFLFVASGFIIDRVLCFIIISYRLITLLSKI